MARNITDIVIHCAATPNGEALFRGAAGTPGYRTPVMEIDGWHKQRGFARKPEWRRRQNPALSAIGYHFVIYTNGALATGRHVDEVGAHAAGHNAHSLGVCMLGTDRFTAAQWDTLKRVVTMLRADFRAERVQGHRDLSPDANGDGAITPNEWTKTCPGFDVATWLTHGMAPRPEWVLA